MKTLIKSLIVIIALLTASFLANAQAPGQHNPHIDSREFYRQKSMSAQQGKQQERPNSDFFTSEQKEKMKAMSLEQYQATKPLIAKMKVLQAQKEALIAEDRVNISAVNSVLDDISALQNEMAKIKVKYRISMSEMLSTEQKMQLEMKKRGNRKEMNKGNKQKMKNHPRPGR